MKMKTKHELNRIIIETRKILKNSKNQTIHKTYYTEQELQESSSTNNIYKKNN